ncbi:condensation domain-containing protein, partial [Salmonella enterica]|uniref:condensation domain-containing protein n=1 Tax=Salmonella enterica TaxID=28901 RepID=UPI003D288708
IAALAALAGEVVSEVVEDAAGDIPQTPIQAWFFERFPEGENHWNQAVLLQARDLDTDRLARGLGQLVARHDALRLRFTRQADGWHQAVAAPHPVQIETATPDELQRRLDIT